MAAVSITTHVCIFIQFTCTMLLLFFSTTDVFFRFRFTTWRTIKKKNRHQSAFRRGGTKGEKSRSNNTNQTTLAEQRPVIGAVKCDSSTACVSDTHTHANHLWLGSLLLLPFVRNQDFSLILHILRSLRPISSNQTRCSPSSTPTHTSLSLTITQCYIKSSLLCRSSTSHSNNAAVREREKRK